MDHPVAVVMSTMTTPTTTTPTTTTVLQSDDVVIVQPTLIPNHHHRKRPRLLPDTIMSSSSSRSTIKTTTTTRKQFLSPAAPTTTGMINETHSIPDTTDTAQQGNSTNTTDTTTTSSMDIDLIRIMKLRHGGTSSTRNEVLNELLMLTSNHETNYALPNDSLLKELVDICIFDCFLWKEEEEEDRSDESKNNKNHVHHDNDNYYYEDHDMNDWESGRPIFRSKYAWTRPPTKRMEEWIQHCSTIFMNDSISTSSSTTMLSNKDERIRMLEVIVMIFRNLSFVGANIRLLIYTPHIFCILLGCICTSTEHSSNSNNNNNNSTIHHHTSNECRRIVRDYYESNKTSGTDNTNNNIKNNSNNPNCGTTTATTTSSSFLCLTAIQTIMNLTRYMDVTGQMILCDKLFYNTNYVENIKSASTTCAPVPTTYSSISSSTNSHPTSTSSSFGICLNHTFGFGGMYLARKLDTKEDTVADISYELLLSLTSDYLVAIWSLFPVLYRLLFNSTTSSSSSNISTSTTTTTAPRPVMLAALDLLIELCQPARAGSIVWDVIRDNDDDDNINLNEQLDGSSSIVEDGTTTTTTGKKQPRRYASEMPTLRAILVHIPTTLLCQFIDWLYVPRLGPDSFDYIDPVQNVVTRVTTLKLGLGYDASIDTDIRDRVLEILVRLCELDSPTMALRICHREEEKTKKKQQKIDSNSIALRTCLFDYIIPILSTTVGRNEASTLGIQLLREIGKGIAYSQQIQIGLLYIQSTLLELASTDQRIAHLVFNDLYRIPDDNNNDDDDDEDEMMKDNDDEIETDSNKNKNNSTTGSDIAFDNNNNNKYKKKKKKKNELEEIDSD